MNSEYKVKNTLSCGKEYPVIANNIENGMRICFVLFFFFLKRKTKSIFWLNNSLKKFVTSIVITVTQNETNEQMKGKMDMEGS